MLLESTMNAKEASRPNQFEGLLPKMRAWTLGAWREQIVTRKSSTSCRGCVTIAFSSASAREDAVGRRTAVTHIAGPSLEVMVLSPKGD